ncbi:MAG: hypothetical protein IJ955_04420 [Oscillospiraceae bacterium]|nr:hypothetical protein [Oscillospiraceae bacterium]
MREDHLCGDDPHQRTEEQGAERYPTQIKAVLADCFAMIPSAYNDTSVMQLGEILGGVKFP